MDGQQVSSSAVLGIVVIIGLIFFGVIASQAIRIVREYERLVVFRMGRLRPVYGPGIRWLWPFIDRPVVVDLRIITMDVPRQELMTRDNVPVTVDAVVYFRVLKPDDAINRVENFIKATSLFAQTTLRSIIGQAELDELLAHRDKINVQLQQILDQHTDPWGIKVSNVEVRDVSLPDGMKRAMARQAEVERERRAKVINAEGEFQAAQRLQEAAHIMGSEPISVQLRFLQTLSEVASEHNSTTIFPVPIDLFAPFVEMLRQREKPAPKQ
jgi:regulator of protease activity HflC (stomatin/prohibitin superfamily)